MHARNGPDALAGAPEACIECRREHFDNTLADSRVLRGLRRRRHVERVCRLRRLLAKLLHKVDRHPGIGTDLHALLTRYAEFDLDLLHVLGGGGFLPALIYRLPK